MCTTLHWFYSQILNFHFAISVYSCVIRKTKADRVHARPIRWLTRTPGIIPPRCPIAPLPDTCSPLPPEPDIVRTRNRTELPQEVVGGPVWYRGQVPIGRDVDLTGFPGLRPTLLCYNVSVAFSSALEESPTISTI